ncbi:MAG: transposase [Dinghuibacter sp.]|nr:transposase [Dinghuibacter sp.]
MGVHVKQIQKRRCYSESFKRSVVASFERGRYSVCQLSRLYGIANSAIYRWIYKYSTFNQSGARVVELKKSDMNKTKMLEQRVKELEQMVGQKQIKIEYLEKMIELAKSELHIDIKKNFNTPQLTGSGTIGKK